MEIISKNLGYVDGINIHIALLDGKRQPYILFADCDDDSVILAMDSNALKRLIRILHLADASVRLYERTVERELEEKRRRERDNG